MKIIFGLGDSITYGAWGQNTHGWCALLRAHLDSQEPYPQYYFYALGIPGETSAGLRGRFKQELDVRKRSDDESFLYLVACGANDATWLNGGQRFKQSLEEYSNNMRFIFNELRTRPGKVYALNVTPVNEAYSKEFKGKDYSCLNEYVDKYNQALALICDELDIELVDINAVFKSQGVETNITMDGVHPNDEGHNLIFENVKNLV